MLRRIDVYSMSVWGHLLSGVLSIECLVVANMFVMMQFKNSAQWKPFIAQDILMSLVVYV